MSLPPGNILTAMEAGDPIVALTGEHLGCYELFASERVGSVRELKGKRVAIDGFGAPQHVFLSSIAAYVGLDPRKDIDWVVGSSAEALQFFIDGKADAFLAFPPEPQELRVKKIGHVLLSTTADKPWSQYYCCMVSAHRDFVQKYPVATKRALRAILKAADLCVEQPERAARMIVAKGFTPSYDYALKTLREVSYGAWRTHDPEDTLRFHGVRLHEVGMIKTAPQKLIAQGTDWRFLNELRKELKA
jgi:NitT/TauT family transport system substrate-binding protein